jgi:hypothetical protein
VGGLDAAFLLNAVSFLVIAAILWTLPPSIAGPDQPRPGSEAEPGRRRRCTHGAWDPAAVPATAVTDGAASIPAAADGRPDPDPGHGRLLDGGIQALTIILAVTV